MATTHWWDAKGGCLRKAYAKLRNCGTTGESPTLSWDENYQLFKVVQQAVAGKAKTIAGTGANSTSSAIAATARAAELGLDGSLQVVPYYNKPPQSGLYKHFRLICP